MENLLSIAENLTLEHLSLDEKLVNIEDRSYERFSIERGNYKKKYNNTI